MQDLKQQLKVWDWCVIAVQHARKQTLLHDQFSERSALLFPADLR